MVQCRAEKFSPFLWRLLLILNYGHVHSFYRRTNFTRVVHEHSRMRALTLCTLTIDALLYYFGAHHIFSEHQHGAVYNDSYVMCMIVAAVSAQGGFMHTIQSDSIDNT